MALLDGKQIRNQSISLNKVSDNGTVTFTTATVSFDTGAVLRQSDANILTGLDVVNKNYVDAVATGLHIKEAVVAISITPITLSGTGSVVDGWTLSLDDRILVNGQAGTGVATSSNGIYVVSGVSWTRATDSDGNPNNEVSEGDFVFVSSGTTYADTGWAQINAVTTLGTDPIEWQQFSGAGTFLAGQGIELDGTTFNVLIGDALEFTGTNAIDLASTVAGAGLSLTAGVLAVEADGTTIAVVDDEVQIASTYVGQTSITTLGTITTGTWNGTTIGVAYGGTGLSSHSYGDLLVGDVAGGLSTLTVGASGKVLQSNGSTLVYGDVDGGTY